MDHLIEALTIFKKYVEPDSYAADYPTNCEHDVLSVCISPSLVSQDDLLRLGELGFMPDDYDGFMSYKYGSC